MITYGRHEVTDSDIQAVIGVLRSDYLTQGEVVPTFEAALCKKNGASYAVVMNSATSALHSACLALGVGQGDIVWTSAITFVASANCAIYCGAQVDFIDIDPNTYNMSPTCLEEKLKIAAKKGTLPKVVIPVHMCGQSCDMEAIFKLSLQYGFRIIEDASHAIGGRYKDKKIGSCIYSDISIFSFHPVKIITTGEGGAALTNSNDLYERLVQCRSHGITSNKHKMLAKPQSEIWNYQQVEIGFNYRMTDIQAALGLSQLARLESYVDARNALANNYQKLLYKAPVSLPYLISEAYSSFHLYVVRLNLEKIRLSQREVFNLFHERKIMVNLHYIPVYRHPYYERKGFRVGYCPQAEKYYADAITLPLYPNLSFSDQKFIVDTLLEIAI